MQRTLRWLAIILILVLALCLSPHAAQAQDQDTPKVEVFGGYSFMRANIVVNGLTFNMNGGSGSVACMIVEPVLGNGGNIVPPPGYFSALAEIARNTGMLLIAAAIMVLFTGAGRSSREPQAVATAAL